MTEACHLTTVFIPQLLIEQYQKQSYAFSVLGVLEQSFFRLKILS
jgi:hypothetical protein